MNVIEAKLRSAGRPVDGDRLYVVAAEIVGQDGTTPKAVARMRGEVMRDVRLLDAMILAYLETVRADMAPKSLPGNGHGVTATQRHDAQARQSQDDGGGHATSENHKTSASPVVAEIPTARRAVARRAATAIAVQTTVMDTFKLSTGAAIGDVYWGSLHRLRAQSARDAALLRILLNYGNADPHAKVRDVISVEQLQRAIQLAAEIADAM